MRVRDGMSSVVLTVGPSHSLSAAARLMTERNVGAAVHDVPVLRMFLLDDLTHQDLDRVRRSRQLGAQGQPRSDARQTVGRVRHLAEGVGTAMRVREQLLYESAGCLDAIVERGVGVRFAENRDPIAKTDVVVVEAWTVVERCPAAFLARPRVHVLNGE